MAQAAIISHLVYFTGSLPGLLTLALDLQHQSILNKAACDHGSPQLKAANDFLAQKKVKSLRGLEGPGLTLPPPPITALV